MSAPPPDGPTQSAVSDVLREGNAEQTSRLPTMFRALRHRNFRLFISGQLISLTGTWMQMVAQSWLIYKLTGSSALLGLIGFVSQFPIFVLAPFGGAVADRRSPHRILMITQSSEMLCVFVMATLILAGHVQVWQLFVLAGITGIINAFDIPARQVLTVQLVGKQDLSNAIALNSSMFNGARMAGPAIAGILVASIGEGWCFMLNAFSYLAVLAGLFAIRLAPRPAQLSEQSMLAEIAGGFQYVYRTRPIRAIMLLLALVSMMGMPYAVLMPVFAGSILHAGPEGLGTLMAASGIGALLGAITLASRRGVVGLGRLVALATITFGGGLILFSFSRTFWLSVALLVPTGFAFISQMAASNTLVQSMVPDQLRGRVMAVYSMMFMGMAPVGGLIAGMMAGWIGAPLTITFGGAFCLVGGFLFRATLESLRGEARELLVAQGALAGCPAQEVTTDVVPRQ